MRKMFMLGVSLAVMMVPAMGQNPPNLGNQTNMRSDGALTGSLSTTPVVENYEMQVEITPWAEVVWDPAGNTAPAPLTLVPNGSNLAYGPDIKVAANTDVTLHVYETLGQAFANAGLHPKVIWGSSTWQNWPFSTPALNSEGHINGDTDHHVVSPNLAITMYPRFDAGRTAIGAGLMSASRPYNTAYGWGLGGMVNLTYDGTVSSTWWTTTKTAPGIFDGHYVLGTYMGCGWVKKDQQLGAGGEQWDWTDVTPGMVTSYELIALVTEQQPLPTPGP